MLYTTPLICAATAGHLELVKLLVDNNADIELASPEDNHTPLMAAALYGHDKIVDFLINKGAHVNARNDKNETALTWAAAEIERKLDRTNAYNAIICALKNGGAK